MVGGGHSVDVFDAGDGQDFASGDCVLIIFNQTDYFITSIASTSIDVGGEDALMMGDGNDIAIGGQNIDTIYGGKKRKARACIPTAYRPIQVV